MDWYISADDSDAVKSLRRKIMEYLERHGEPGASLVDAEHVVVELLSNVTRHSDGPAWVSLVWRGKQPELVVRDLGPGFDPTVIDREESAAMDEDPLLVESGRGLMMAQGFADRLEAQARKGGGMAVSATLPVARAASKSYDPPRHQGRVLPEMSEVQPTGGFDRETFLRALVVQLAQTVEFQQGPDAAEAAVAQVGADIGGQMEEEFRAAEDIVGQLTPQQVAECYVRLKAAIGGGFSILEVTDDRIVLGNTKCPFGQAVQRAPALCRMTSAVFGGIGVRNAPDGAAGVDVLLEERIAVGDPQCKVTVMLRPDANMQPSDALHHYALQG